MSELQLQSGAIHSIPVKKIEKSTAWYRNNLGFELVVELDDPCWCELIHPVSQIRVGLAEVQDVETGGMSLLLPVSNLSSALQALSNHKIQSSEEVSIDGYAKVATFEDPDGNSLMLIERSSN